MRKQAVFKTLWRETVRYLRATRAQLRGRGVAWLCMAVLVLSLGEPLACIVHCDFWLPYLEARHQAQMHTHDHASMMDMSAGDSAHDMANMATSDYDPKGHMSQSPDTHSGHTAMPPSPVHEVLLANVHVYALVFLFAHMLLALPFFMRSIAHTPRLRPPIFA